MGVYQTPQGYYVKDEDVEEFDKQFPPKERKKLPGQLFDWLQTEDVTMMK